MAAAERIIVDLTMMMTAILDYYLSGNLSYRSAIGSVCNEEDSD